jgi:hypothetical protein
MRRTLPAVLLVTLLLGTTESTGPQQPISRMVLQSEPDPTQARPMDRWPTQEELDRL